MEWWGPTVPTLFPSYPTLDNFVFHQEFCWSSLSFREVYWNNLRKDPNPFLLLMYFMDSHFTIAVCWNLLFLRKHLSAKLKYFLWISVNTLLFDKKKIGLFFVWMIFYNYSYHYHCPPPHHDHTCCCYIIMKSVLLPGKEKKTKINTLLSYLIKLKRTQCYSLPILLS